MAKIKQKTHKATAKKFRIRNSGSVKYKRAGANHNTVGYSSKRLRKILIPILSKEETLIKRNSPLEKLKKLPIYIDSYISMKRSVERIIQKSSLALLISIC